MAKKTKKPIYYPQAFLLYQLGYLNGKQLKESGFKGKVQSGPTIAKLKGTYTPASAASRISTGGGKKVIKMNETFLNLDNHKIPFLTPEIRLYKVAGGSATPIYMPVGSEFDTTTVKGKTMFNPEKTFHGSGVELQSFNFTMAGKNPYDASRKFLNATLSLKVENISIIFQKKQGFAPIADLFTVRSPESVPLPGSQGPTGGALSSGRNCHIAVTVGYAQPDFYDMFTVDEGQSIVEQQSALNLFYSGHDLSLAADGSATISVNYTGFMQSMDDFFSDITSTPIDKADYTVKATFAKDSSDISKNISPTKEKKNAQGGDDDEKSKQEEKKKDHSDSLAFFREILDRLNNKKNIYSIDSDHKTLVEFYKRGPSTTKEGESAPPGAESPEAQQKDPDSVFKKNRVHYFNFGDFLVAYLEVMVKHLKDADKHIESKVKTKPKPKLTREQANQAKQKLAEFKSDFKKLTVLMANCEISTPESGDKSITRVINISDLPVSLDTLYTMVFDKITGKGVMFYDMNNFMSNFCLGLINKSFLSVAKGADMIKEVTIRSSNTTGRDLRSKLYKGEIKMEDVPPRNSTFTKKNIASTREYFTFNQEPSKHTAPPGAAHRAEDAMRGIFHIRPNKDKGLVKSVSFSKVSNPSREAYLVVRNGDIYDELRIPHDASVSMYGNNMFLPGSVVYIDPSSLGFGSPTMVESAASRLGLGGYYVVESVKTSYSNGALDTSLSLKFNCFPTGKTAADLPKEQRESISKMQNLLGG